jgi:hypothetical protein
MIINSGFAKGRGSRNEAGDHHTQLTSGNFSKLEGLGISPVSKKPLESRLEIVVIP